MGFVKEFREFALKGNVLDMAVGVIIGVEFGKIVNSIINDLLMPIIGAIMPNGLSFADSYVPLAAKAREEFEKNPKMGLVEAKQFGAVLAYGNFITIAINFTILAFCVFLVVKAFNIARKRMERDKANVPPAPPPPPSEEVLLLREIRDSLKVT